MNEIIIPQANQMLQALGDTKYTFQTFDDNADRKDGRLARQFYGTLDEHAKTLHALNAQGAGVYVTVNATDGKGRKSANITAVRALFVDFDTPDDGRVARLLALDCPPSLIVESSKDKHHAYWTCNGIDTDDFSICQKRLISHFATQGDTPDKAVHDLPRVMRLAGFTHSKVRDGDATTPFITQVVHSGNPYEYDALMAWLASMDDDNHSISPMSRLDITHTVSDDGDNACDYVRRQANGRWLYVLNRLGYDVGNGAHTACPACGGKDRFRFDDQDGRGTWLCSQGGQGTVSGDGLSFLIDHVGLRPKDAIDKVCDVLGITVQDNTTHVDVTGLINQCKTYNQDDCIVDVTTDSYKTKQTPTDLFSLPIDADIDAELTQIIQSHNEQAPPELVLLAKLALLNTLAGRRYLSESNNPTNMYYMVLAPTGTGKNIIKDSINAILHGVGCSHLLSGSGSTSSSAVISSLMTAPNQIQIIDEFGQVLKSSRASNSNHTREAYATVMEVYGSHASSVRAKNFANLKKINGEHQPEPPIEVLCPSLTLMTMATPMQVINALSTDDLENGFLNRFCVVHINASPLDDNDLDDFCITDQKMPMSPSGLLTDFCQALSGSGNLGEHGVELYDQRPDFITLQWAQDAKDYINKYYRRLKRAQKDKNDELYTGLSMRRCEQVMRLATTLASAHSISTDELVIKASHVIYAIGFFEHFAEIAYDFFRQNLADSPFMQIRQIVIDSLDKVKDVDAKRGLTMRDLSRISSIFAKTPLHVRTPALATMIADEQILYVSIKSKGGRGGSSARQAFIKPQFFDANLMQIASF